MTEAYIPVDVQDIASIIAPGADVTLTARGRFALVPSGSMLPTISPARAVELATTYLANAIGDNLGLWQRECQCILDAGALTSQRTYYAQSPFAAHQIPAVGRNSYGPYYLVLFGEKGSRPLLTVAVSAFAVYLKIADGRVQWPGYGATEFHTLGVPPGYIMGMPDSPEAAATRVAQATGALISSAPVLLEAGFPYAPQLARWRIGLDRNVTVLGANGELSQVNELWVDWRGNILRRTNDGSGTIVIWYLDRVDDTTKKISISRTAPTAFEPISVPQ